MKEGRDEFLRRNDLQFCFMERHERLAEGLFRITYSNGARMYVNYAASVQTADGVTVPSMDYVLVRK